MPRALALARVGYARIRHPVASVHDLHCVQFTLARQDLHRSLGRPEELDTGAWVQYGAADGTSQIENWSFTPYAVA